MLAYFENVRRRLKVVRLSCGACGDGGLDDISHVDSALGRGSNGKSARLSVSSRRATIVVRTRNESSTSGESTRCRSSGQSSRDLGSSVDGGEAGGRLQAGGDASDLEVVFVETQHVDVVA